MSSFLETLRQAQFRFYQERDLGLDLYHAGWSGTLLFALLVASGVVFLLAIFHLLPARRHIVALLLGLGLTAALTGLATSWWNHAHFEAVAARVIRDSAGPVPASPAQTAAVLALPLVVGSIVLAGDCLGCLYMAFFWATGISRQK
jgi:hypothetical protein